MARSKSPADAVSSRRSLYPGDHPRSRRPREADGWRIMSYMIAGMAFYGAMGWLAGHWTGISVLFPVGMIFGLGCSIALIIFRVTRS
jgi:ATP synthase protein I